MSKQVCVKALGWTLLLLCFSCSHKSTKAPAGFQKYYFDGTGTVVGKIFDGHDIHIGGFSGLQAIESENSQDELFFWTVTDRGPNGEPLKSNSSDLEVRPFLSPEYTPRIYKLKLDQKSSDLKIVDEILLSDPLGKPLTGLPNMEKADETPVNVNGQPLSYDLMGIDPEGVARDSDGNFWVCDEYRPSLLKFDSAGKLIRKFVPRSAYSRSDLQKIWQDHGHVKITEAFPQEVNFRRQNRGFEGLTIKGQHLIIALQSPLRIPEAKNHLYVRFFDFDITSEKVVATYIYPLESENVDRIGDIAWTEHGLYVIEQNGKDGKKGVHQIYLVKELTPFLNHQPNSIPESMGPESLQEILLKKQLVLDLHASGFSEYEKVEGIAVLKDGRIVISTDNDFGIDNKGVTNPQQIRLDYDKKPVIAIFGTTK